MGWKQCVTGSYDYLNKKGEIIFHIFRLKEQDVLSGSSRYSGQVFYGNKYSVLVYDADLSVFLMKALIIAKDKGWEISIKDFDLNPDFSNIEKYKSKMYLENYEEIQKINKKRSKLKGCK